MNTSPAHRVLFIIGCYIIFLANVAAGIGLFYDDEGRLIPRSTILAIMWRCSVRAY